MFVDIAAGIIPVKEAGGITNEINLSNTENLNVIASSQDIGTKLDEKLNSNCLENSFIINLKMKKKISELIK